ncbi:TetR/AcrR family transcriptional regulator [Granulicella sp. S190]|uniref:TetR/AcrR family transcriptional regulator n=1 Tax=Granulicella sp. S190 TaxID=1747226 RepID=UPI00131EAAAD|nr:TetR/AcrR family transcriptional regulator [Granulicella sp. S190]
MARVKNPANRSAILQAATYEIAEAGLAAPTAKIAKRANIATGTLFTYFANKEELINELYLELKREAYARINSDFPHKSSLEARTRHVWSSFLYWALEFPEKRKVSIQLTISNLVTPETRMQTAIDRGAVDKTLSDLGNRASLRGLPDGFAAATMSAMQEVTIDAIAKRPRQRERIIDRAFEVFWRAIR